MTTMTQTKTKVIGGVDAHGDVHVAAAIDQIGHGLGPRVSRRLGPGTGNYSPGCAVSATWSGSAWREPVRGVRACAVTWPGKA